MKDTDLKMSIACKQVYTILSLYNQELLELIIPKEVLKNLKENANEEYEYNITMETFDADVLTEEASALLLVIFEKYFATEEQKRKINRFLSEEEYKTKELFSKKNENQQSDNKNQQIDDREDDEYKNNKMVVYSKKNILEKIFEKIKLILGGKHV